MSIQTAKPKRRKAPKHKGEIRAYRFAMVVPPSRMGALFDACDILLDLRNRLVVHLAENRRVNREYKQNGQADQVHYPDRAELYRLVSAWAAEDERLSGVHSHLRQNVVTRVLEGVSRWLEAVAEGKGGVRPPRPKDKKHYRSFTFPEYGNGCRINSHRVYLSGFGWFKLHDHRKIAGRPKTVTVKFSQGRWWCTVTAQSFERDLHAPLAADDIRPDLGGDPGLENLLTTSDGQVFSPRKPYHEARADLRRAQKAVSRKFQARETAHEALCAAARARGEKAPSLKDAPYSKRLQDAIRALARRHTKVERVRDHEQKKLASMSRPRRGRPPRGRGASPAQGARRRRPACSGPSPRAGPGRSGSWDRWRGWPPRTPVRRRASCRRASSGPPVSRRGPALPEPCVDTTAAAASSQCFPLPEAAAARAEPPRPCRHASSFRSSRIARDWMSGLCSG